MYDITTSDANKDAGKTRDEYLGMFLADGFISKLPLPAFYPSPERDDIFILDFAINGYSLKTYGAEKLIATTQSGLLGYAAPRVGLASEAVAKLSQMYGKNTVFFAAASKEVTKHQAVVMSYGCELRFVKIPAMTTMNAWIRQWAKKFDGIALPFGLADVELVTAGLVSMCENHSMVYGEPAEFYCAVSTGTMVRALQIGWPGAKAVGVAVARNIKDGEKGAADVVSYHKSFYKSSDLLPDFPSTSNYDAKAYERFLVEGKPGAIFINVGSEQQVYERMDLLPKPYLEIKTSGERAWGNQEAFETK